MTNKLKPKLDKIVKFGQEIAKEGEIIEKLVHSEVIENKHILKKLLEIERLIKGEENVHFINVDEWKMNIWNTCKFKKQSDNKDEVYFLCKKTKDTCHFSDCPLNNSKLKI